MPTWFEEAAFRLFVQGVYQLTNGKPDQFITEVETSGVPFPVVVHGPCTVGIVSANHSWPNTKPKLRGIGHVIFHLIPGSLELTHVPGFLNLSKLEKGEVGRDFGRQ